MSRFDDYPDEMAHFSSLSDDAVDRLIDGSSEDPAHAALLVLVESIRRQAAVQVGEDTVERYMGSAAAAAASRVEGTGSAVGASTAGVIRGPVRRRRVIAVVGATVLFALAISGVAAAVNGAKPGDIWYGLDRALEAVGFGDGGGSERIAEVRALFDDGELSRSLEHAADAVPDVAHDPRSDDASAAADALRDAAGAVVSEGSERSAKTRSAVHALLTYLSENSGDIDPILVAELARSIGTRSGEPASPSGRPQNPGRPENPGPPDQAPPAVPSPPADPPGASNRP